MPRFETPADTKNDGRRRTQIEPRIIICPNGTEIWSPTSIDWLGFFLVHVHFGVPSRSLASVVQRSPVWWFLSTQKFVGQFGTNCHHPGCALFFFFWHTHPLQWRGNPNGKRMHEHTWPAVWWRILLSERWIERDHSAGKMDQQKSWFWSSPVVN